MLEHHDLYAFAKQGRVRKYASVEEALAEEKAEQEAVKLLLRLGYEIKDEFGRDMREFKLA